MKLSLSALRQNIFQCIDSLIETGEPIIINRKGHVIKITSESSKAKNNKLKKLKKRKTIVGDPESIIKNDWEQYWEEKDKI